MIIFWFHFCVHFKVIYEHFRIKEKLEKSDCNKTDKHWLYLKEYFDQYEKEYQMEDFLGKVFIFLMQLLLVKLLFFFVLQRF